MDYITILGRLPKISLAELERVYGATAVLPFSLNSAVVKDSEPDVQKLGGVTKAGRVILRLPVRSWSETSNKIIQAYVKKWQKHEGKQTLGISVYDWSVSPRDIQKTGLAIKSSLKRHDVSLRLIPNSDASLNTATSHHNKLGLSENKTELLIVKGAHEIIVAESTGAQNITALAKRDQGRPKRDAFVGMLPPKLALTMINLSGISSGRDSVFSKTSAARDSSGGGTTSEESRSEAVLENTESKVHKRLLDPFCGTGVILQEAALLGFNVYGTDLADKMVDYSTQNLDWLTHTHHLSSDIEIHQGDAMTTTWHSPIDAVVAETYLGQPFSAPPSPAKLTEVRGNCNHIITSFLKNLSTQIPSGTPLCLAVPAWRNQQGSLTHLPIIDEIGKLGYNHLTLTHATESDLIYYREDQVVARQLLILTRR